MRFANAIELQVIGHTIAARMVAEYDPVVRMLKKEVFHPSTSSLLHRRSQSEVRPSAERTCSSGLSTLIKDDFHRGGTLIAEPKVFTSTHSFAGRIMGYIEQEQFAAAQVAKGHCNQDWHTSRSCFTHNVKCAAAKAGGWSGREKSKKRIQKESSPFRFACQ